MKKVGIITLFGIFNYGNRLQNYALNHSLETQGYVSCSLIDVNKTFFFKQYIKKMMAPFLARSKSGINNRSLLFYAFLKKTLNH